MNTILKIEAFAGMSGDMFLGALAGLADAYDALPELPKLLHLDKEAEIVVTDVVKNGIQCKQVRVIDKTHYHLHNDEHDQDRFLYNVPPHAEGHHHARHLKDIYGIIDNGHIGERAKKIAKEIFFILGTAESQIHGVNIESIHFHEVGAIDSIIDIVGSAWLIDKLNIEKTYCTTITTGYGFAKTEHGRLPIPCPATQLLLHGFPTIAGDEMGELTTPTGAAILKFLSPSFEIPSLTEMKTSYGPGEKELQIPNTLRLNLCSARKEKEEIVVLQTNIDDLSGEYLGIEFQQRLMEQGALDFYFEQVIMKKGRPGVVLTVIAPRSALQQLSNFIFENTSTIGIRYYTVDRVELKRSLIELPTSLGPIQMKEVELPKGKKRLKPENDDVQRLSDENKISPIEIVQSLNSIDSKGKIKKP